MARYIECHRGHALRRIRGKIYSVPFSLFLLYLLTRLNFLPSMKRVLKAMEDWNSNSRRLWKVESDPENIYRTFLLRDIFSPFLVLTTKQRRSQEDLMHARQVDLLLNSCVRKGIIKEDMIIWKQHTRD